MTSEAYTNSVSQSTTGSIRFKAGVVTPLAGWYGSIMPYVTVGWVRSRFEGTFTYNASNFSSFSPSCSFNPSCSTIAGASASWSHQANGVIYGFGVDIPISAVGPGVVLVLDYSRADFQSFDVTVPVHRPGCFFKDGKQTDWQWQQSGSFHFFEKFSHLLPSGPVDAGVRHVGFPIQ